MPAPQGDFFDRARAVSGAAMFAAGAAAVIGSLLDWVNIVALPARLPAGERARAQPFTGIEAGDGWITLAGGLVLLACASMLMLRRSSGWAWLGFLASIAIGAIAIADYRSIDDIFRRQLDRVGNVEPSFGLMLVAAAGVVGVVASMVGVAATPSTRPGA